MICIKIGERITEFFLLIHALLPILRMRKSREDKFKITYIFFNFPAPFYAEFPRSQDKKVEISKKFLSFSTLFLYIVSPWSALIRLKKNFKIIDFKGKQKQRDCDFSKLYFFSDFRALNRAEMTTSFCQ